MKHKLYLLILMHVKSKVNNRKIEISNNLFFLMLFFGYIIGCNQNYFSSSQYTNSFSWSQLTKPLVNIKLQQCQRFSPRSLKLEQTPIDRICQAASPTSFTFLSLNRLLLQDGDADRRTEEDGLQRDRVMKQMHRDKQK